ncbi:hypothetical protein ACIQM4_31525 [Streptomyces sp. NPDC091272]|uniref:hypothetical protein n=1 Tax=Streptomyces sp. NPDC091272 TaxID=3365981 RepID=UPI003826EF64
MISARFTSSRGRRAASVVAGLAVTGAALTAATAAPASAAPTEPKPPAPSYGYDGHYGDAWTGGRWGQDYYRYPKPKVAQADLKVSASGPAHIDHNQEQVWRVVVTNVGKSTAADVNLVTTLPNGISHVADRVSQGSSSYTPGGNLVAGVGSLKPGATVTLELAGKGPSYGGGTVHLRTEAGTSSRETNTANNSASVATRIS